VAFAVGVIGVVIAIAAFQPGVLIRLFEPPIEDVPCPRVFDDARDILTKESRRPSPPEPGLRFVPSQDLPGRVDARLAWQNPVGVSKWVVAVSGHYGALDPSDDHVDHTEPAAASGQCWDWYHQGPSDDAQPKTVRASVQGLWPEQRYCFYVAYKDSSGGWSKPSSIFCQAATWQSSWGTPARLP
jgi:hypothetical protein